MKIVFILLAMLIVSVSASDTIDRQTNRQLAYSPKSIKLESVRGESPYRYRIEWHGDASITAFHWPNTGNWSFNVALRPNAYYQCSYTEDGAKGVLTEYTCERIIDILLNTRLSPSQPPITPTP